MIIELNASEERGIDVIRNKVRKFTTSSNLFGDNDDMYKNKALYDFSAYSDNYEYYIKHMKVEKSNKKLLKNLKIKLMANRIYWTARK